jgi:uncharacterized membrane protein
MSLPWHLYLMAGLYLLAGLNHFWKPHLYQKIIPPFFKNPKLVNQLSGFAEILLAFALCIPVLTSYAAWGVIVLLLAIFPANIHMFLEKKASLGIPQWVLLLRLPLQFLLIFWAYEYT